MCVSPAKYVRLGRYAHYKLHYIQWCRYRCSKRYVNLSDSRIAQAIMRILNSSTGTLLPVRRAPLKNFQVVILATT